MMGAEDGRRKCVLSTLDWEQLQVRAVEHAAGADLLSDYALIYYCKRVLSDLFQYKNKLVGGPQSLRARSKYTFTCDASGAVDQRGVSGGAGKISTNACACSVDRKLELELASQYSSSVRSSPGARVARSACAKACVRGPRIHPGLVHAEIGPAGRLQGRLRRLRRGRQVMPSTSHVIADRVIIARSSSHLIELTWRGRQLLRLPRRLVRGQQRVARRGLRVPPQRRGRRRLRRARAPASS